MKAPGLIYHAWHVDTTPFQLLLLHLNVLFHNATVFSGERNQLTEENAKMLCLLAANVSSPVLD